MNSGWQMSRATNECCMFEGLINRIDGQVNEWDDIRGGRISTSNGGITSADFEYRYTSQITVGHNTTDGYNDWIEWKRGAIYAGYWWEEQKIAALVDYMGHIVFLHAEFVPHEWGHLICFGEYVNRRNRECSTLPFVIVSSSVATPGLIWAHTRPIIVPGR